MDKIPKNLTDPSFRFIKLRHKGKLPSEKKWQTERNYKYDSNHILKHPANIGIMGGYGNLLIIDFDNALFERAILPRLPETFTVRTPSEGLHHLYFRVDKPFPKFPIKDLSWIYNIKPKDWTTKDGFPTLADMVCNGAQAVMPGSIHPKGGTYTITKDIPIVNITIAQLRDAFGTYLQPPEKKETYEKVLEDPDVERIKKSVKLGTILSLMKVDISKNPCKCPFHPMKGQGNLSFDDKKGVFQCFHENWGGDVITLWMRHKGIGFIEAKNELMIMLEPPKEEKEKSCNLKMYTWKELSEMDIPSPEYLVNDFLIKNGVTVLGGDSGAGKSLLSLTLSLCLSRGKSFLNRDMEASGVFYIDEENHIGIIKDRADKLSKGLGLKSSDNLKFFIANNFKINGAGNKPMAYGISLSALRESIEEYKPKLIVLDSLVRFFNGDENSASESRGIFDSLKRLIEEYGVSFLILHHTKKGSNGNKDSLRGSGDLSAMADIVLISSKKPGSNTLKINQVKNRFEPEIHPFFVNIEGYAGELNLEFSHDQKPKKDMGVEELKKIIFADGKFRFTRKEITQKMKDKGVKVASIKQALEDLAAEGLISKYGYYAYDVIGMPEIERELTEVVHEDDDKKKPNEVEF